MRRSSAGLRSSVDHGHGDPEECMRWTNEKLAEVNQEPLQTDLKDSFRDGTTLAYLLLALRKEKVKVKKSRHAAVCRSNIDAVLSKFRDDKKLDLGNSNASDFYEGNEKQISTFLFVIRERYDHVSSPRSPKKPMTKNEVADDLLMADIARIEEAHVPDPQPEPEPEPKPLLEPLEQDIQRIEPAIAKKPKARGGYHVDVEVSGWASGLLGRSNQQQKRTSFRIF